MPPKGHDIDDYDPRNHRIDVLNQARGGSLVLADELVAEAELLCKCCLQLFKLDVEAQQAVKPLTDFNLVRAESRRKPDFVQ